MMNLNECLIAEQKKEITELKSHVERLRLSFKAVYGHLQRDGLIKGRLGNILINTLKSTPAQSLQEHDRQVILDAVKKVEGYSYSSSGNILVCPSFKLEEYANNLTNGEVSEAVLPNGSDDNG